MFRTYLICVLFLLIVALQSNGKLAANEPDLLGHWRFTSNTEDSSPNKLHGTKQGVKIKDAAQFDGLRDHITVPHQESLSLGTGNFTLAAWVNTDENLDDVLGTVLSKYDPQLRRGFQLSIKNQAGVTSSQSNFRHVHFGIDNDQIEPAWTDHGQPGNAIYIFTLATYQNQLFAGTCVADKSDSGHVYRFAGGQKWIDCGSPDKSNSVTSLAVHQGKLYAATGKYRLRGTSLTESNNETHGGGVYRYEGEGNWTFCGKLPETEAIFGLVNYKGKLYASSLYAPAGFYRYEGGTEWTSLGTYDGKRVEAMTVHNGYLYATGFDEGAVYRFDGQEWTHVGKVGTSTQTYGFTTYQGDLYVTEWPNAEIYRYQGGSEWELAGKLGDEKEAMPLIVYNGQMYSGSLPLGIVYRYDGGTNWSDIGRLDMTPDVRYRRVWSMGIFQGRLFAGTVPAGRVYSIEAGKSATCDTALPSGWQHITAIKADNHLKLYINGELVATSSRFDPKDYDLTTEKPLQIGFGAHDYFNGAMKDVRIYGRALNEEEVKKLAK